MRRFVLSIESDEVLSTALDRVGDPDDVVWMGSAPQDPRCRAEPDLLAGILAQFANGQAPSVWLSLTSSDLPRFQEVIPDLRKVAAITLVCDLPHKDIVEPLVGPLDLDWVLWVPSGTYFTRDALGEIGALPIFIRPAPRLATWRDGLLRTIRSRELRQRVNPVLSVLLGPALP